MKVATKLPLVALAVVLSANPIMAQSRPRVTFRCALADGQARELAKAKFGPRTLTTGFSEEIVFDTGDGVKGRLIGNVGADDVDVVISEHATTFLQITLSGNPVVTTVMHGTTTSPLASSVAAVMSRHIVRFDGDASVSQIFGTCRVLR